MKQKKIGNKLYVFELEAYEITADTDATVVYVQNHVYDAFKALNPSLNIKRYNYNVIGVNKPEWYDYISATEEELNPEPSETELEPSETEPEPSETQPEPDQSTPSDDPTQPENTFAFANPSESITHIYNPANQQDTYVDLDLINTAGLEPVTFNIQFGQEYGQIVENNGAMQFCVSPAILPGEYTIIVEAHGGENEDLQITPKYIYLNVWSDVVPDNPEESPEEPAFVPTTYSFESFNSNDHSVKYGTGKVQTTEDQVEGYTIVIVTENTFDQYLDTPFVGRTFGISNSAQPGDGQYWPLYEWDTTLTHIEVDVKVYNEDMIPSEAIPSE